MTFAADARWTALAVVLAVAAADASAKGPHRAHAPITSCAAAVAHFAACRSPHDCEDVAYPCAPFGCDAAGKTCATSCEADVDCAAGAKCNVAASACVFVGYSCHDPFTVIGTDGTESSCAPYRCVAGACRNGCSVDADCAPGHACGGGVCTAKP